MASLITWLVRLSVPWNRVWFRSGPVRSGPVRSGPFREIGTSGKQYGVHVKVKTKIDSNIYGQDKRAGADVNLDGI